MQNSNSNIRGVTAPTANTQATINSSNSLKHNLTALQQRSQLSQKSKISDGISTGEVSVFGTGHAASSRGCRNELSRSPLGQTTGKERTMQSAYLKASMSSRMNNHTSYYKS